MRPVQYKEVQSSVAYSPADPARLAVFLRLARAGYSLTEIGRRHSISRQRVHQVLARGGYNIKDLTPPHALTLTRAAHRSLAKQNRQTVCANCGAPLKRPPRADGSPSFCGRPQCHAAWMHWTYHNNPTSKTAQYLRRKKGGPPSGHAAPPTYY